MADVLELVANIDEDKVPIYAYYRNEAEFPSKIIIEEKRDHILRELSDELDVKPINSAEIILNYDSDTRSLIISDVIININGMVKRIESKEIGNYLIENIIIGNIRKTIVDLYEHNVNIIHWASINRFIGLVKKPYIRLRDVLKNI